MAINTTINLVGRYQDWKKEKKQGQEGLARYRTAMKRQVSENLKWPEKDASPEIIIRDLARIDEYPDTDNSVSGISPWFRVEVKGQYHRGLEVLLRLVEVIQERGEAREVRDGSGRTVAVVGLIPYESIIEIDWDGDEFYGVPHFYCWFNQEDGPYEEIKLYELPNKRGFWSEIELEYRPIKDSWWKRWKLRREIRKAQKEFEREFG